MNTNSKVITSWIRGRQANNGRSSLHTNGDSLYSYQLEIGYTDQKGNKIVKLYTGKSGNFRSKTTSSHVNMAAKEADSTEDVS